MGAAAIGIGDEIMITARAAKLRAETGKRVQVVDANRRPRWHPIWAGNPDIAGKRERRGNFTTLQDCGWHRPYTLQPPVTGDRWNWNHEYRASPGRIYLTEDERLFAAPHRGRIIVEPHCKAKASPNKQWGWMRWNKLAFLMQEAGYRVTQLGAPGTPLLDGGVEFIETADIRRAAAVIALARAAVLPEGGTHHIAAAFNVPAVVLFGGYISPQITGYDMHTNVFTGGEACGMRVPCDHCKEAMARIEPEQVFDELLTVLKAERRQAA